MIRSALVIAVILKNLALVKAGAHGILLKKCAPALKHSKLGMGGIKIP